MYIFPHRFVHVFALTSMFICKSTINSVWAFKYLHVHSQKLIRENPQKLKSTIVCFKNIEIIRTINEQIKQEGTSNKSYERKKRPKKKDHKKDPHLKKKEIEKKKEKKQKKIKMNYQNFITSKLTKKIEKKRIRKLQKIIRNDTKKKKQKQSERNEIKRKARRKKRNDKMRKRKMSGKVKK